MDRVTIILLKRHLRSVKGTPDELVYTGKTTDANSLARLMPVFISFVLANLEYFREAHGYALRRNRTIPGQKAHIFAPFRDAWFPHALREIRAEDLGVPLDDVEETQYLYEGFHLFSSAREFSSDRNNSSPFARHPANPMVSGTPLSRRF